MPSYDFKKIKYVTDRPTFERAMALYEKRKVTRFGEDVSGYSALVLGGKSYQVSVSARHFNQGHCDCYLGEKDVLCKHMVALALQAVLKGKKIKEEDKEPVGEVRLSGRLGILTKEETAEVKKEISAAARLIKSYTGPSRTWFAYQNSLSEGCNLLSEVVSKLPVSTQTADLLVKLLLRLDKKLCTGGVDDSDGTVGGFIQEAVQILVEFVKIDPNCLKTFEQLCKQSTCFGWEGELVRMWDERDL